VNYGDLGPGQSATNSAMFPANPSVDPVSSNPHPKLLYTDGNP
jgi:hypothetical protein